MKIVTIMLLFLSCGVANAAPLINAKRNKVSYETDGHYWTVLVVATLLRVPDAKSIAFAAEYPDNVINKDGYIVKSRYTFLYPKSQIKVHALTGGHPEYERISSFNMLKEAQTAQEKGIACHRIGDSFAHTNDKTGRMYPHLVAHLFQWKRPDKIKNNASKYLSYVEALVESFGGQNSEINLFVFNYIARSGLSSAKNAAILKAEYNLLTGSIAFNIKKEDQQDVENYLSERIRSEAYAIHTNSDEKGRETTTVILIKNATVASEFKLITIK